MKIPIFPLKLVMFPGARYPLHIFEERYKSMVNKCLAMNEGFGVVAKHENEISNIGCYVHISKILKKYENGNLDIIVTGLYRFKTLLTNVSDEGYLISSIEEFADTVQEEDNSVLSTEAIERFNQIIKKSQLFLSDTFWNNLATSKRKSFKLAEKSGLSIDQQQSLLKMKSENQRLEYLVHHFEKITEYLKARTHNCHSFTDPHYCWNSTRVPQSVAGNCHAKLNVNNSCSPESAATDIRKIKGLSS